MVKYDFPIYRCCFMNSPIFNPNLKENEDKMHLKGDIMQTIFN